MPASTVIRALPYPLDSDPIDVAGDMQRLAEALDTGIGRTPGKVFATKAALDAEAGAWPDGSVAMVAPGVAYEKLSGVWRLRDELPVFIMPATSVAQGNVAPGLTQSASDIQLLQSPYNRIWRGWIYLNLTGHSAKGNIRVRLRRTSDNADMMISGTGTYDAGDPFIFNVPYSFVKAGGTPTETFRLWFETSGAGSNTNISGSMLNEGVATTWMTA